MLGAVAIALVFLISTASANDVVVLTEDTFENEVGKDRGALVEFYAPWYSLISLRIFIISIQNTNLCFKI